MAFGAIRSVVCKQRPTRCAQPASCSTLRKSNSTVMHPVCVAFTRETAHRARRFCALRSDRPVDPLGSRDAPEENAPTSVRNAPRALESELMSTFRDQKLWQKKQLDQLREKQHGPHPATCASVYSQRVMHTKRARPRMCEMHFGSQ